MVTVDQFVKLLKAHDLKITPQRLEILKYLDKNRTHPSANQIYLNLKKKNPSLSKTTIYNSLDALSKHNIIQELTISKSESRYDFKITPHHHFLCNKCGAIIDLEGRCPHTECPFLNKMQKDKHKIEEVQGYFKGICEKCLKAELQKKSN